VLYTIPVYKDETVQTIAKSFWNHLTSVTFHVYSQTSSTTGEATSSTPIIVILGTRGRPLPASILQWSTSWIAQDRESSAYGTVSVSSDVFLRGKLLPILAEINTCTTVVPCVSGLAGMKLKLTRWSEHSEREESGDTPFELVTVTENEDSGTLKYSWLYEQDVKIKLSKVVNKNYTVHCTWCYFSDLPAANNRF
jgi:hypothetical protein